MLEKLVSLQGIVVLEKKHQKLIIKGGIASTPCQRHFDDCHSDD